MNELPRSHELLNRHTSRLLVIDVQEKLLPAIHDGDRILSNCRKLVSGAEILGVPVTATEQYPQGLGPTVPALAELLPERLEKTDFSCRTCLPWAASGAEPDACFQVVVCGAEAHVCVLQTVLDLLSLGFRVFVAADAIGSRSIQDRDLAIHRLSASGAVITSSEAILFEWCERAGSPEFKQISRLVR